MLNMFNYKLIVGNYSLRQKTISTITTRSAKLTDGISVTTNSSDTRFHVLYALLTLEMWHYLIAITRLTLAESLQKQNKTKKPTKTEFVMKMVKLTELKGDHRN